jgi:hypothetical protein
MTDDGLRMTDYGWDLWEYYSVAEYELMFKA